MTSHIKRREYIQPGTTGALPITIRPNNTPNFQKLVSKNDLEKFPGTRNLYPAVTQPIVLKINSMMSRWRYIMVHYRHIMEIRFHRSEISPQLAD